MIVSLCFSAMLFHCKHQRSQNEANTGPLYIHYAYGTCNLFQRFSGLGILKQKITIYFEYEPLIYSVL